MTLDEAIKYAKHKANVRYKMASEYHTDEGVYLEEETKLRNNADDYTQLAEWLEDYKSRLEGEEELNAKSYIEGLHDGKNIAIDKFAEELKYELYELNSNNWIAMQTMIKNIAQELKGAKE